MHKILLLNSINATLLVLAGSFIAMIGIFYIFRPRWVQVVNKNTGKNEMSLKLTTVYSAIFSVVCAIATLLLFSQYQKKVDKITYDVDVIAPDSTIALAYRKGSH